MNKYTPQIQKRIADYNADFGKTLLKGAELKSLACKFLHPFENWYTSDCEDGNWLINLFKLLKETINSNEKGAFNITYHPKTGLKSNFIQKNILEINELCSEQFKQDVMLIIFSNVDINGDKDIDMRILYIFKVVSSKKLDQNKIDSFLKYPEDFFTSPAIARLLDDLAMYGHLKKRIEEEKIEEVTQMKREMTKDVDKMRAKIRDYGHIMYRNVSGNLNDFNIIKNASSNNPINTIQPNISNIQKRIESIDITMQLLKGDKPIDKFKGKNTLGDMIDIVMNSIVCSRSVELKVDYDDYRDTKVQNQNDLYIILWNLLHNADKHTKNNRPITFSVRSQAQHLQFVISNFAKEEDIEDLTRIIEQKAAIHETQKGYKAIFQSCEKLGWMIEPPIINLNNLNVEIYLKTNLITNNGRIY